MILNFEELDILVLIGFYSVGTSSNYKTSYSTIFGHFKVFHGILRILEFKGITWMLKIFKNFKRIQYNSKVFQGFQAIPRNSYDIKIFQAFLRDFERLNKF